MNRMTPQEIKYIMNVLRQGTIAWVGRKEALVRARIKKFDRRNKKTGEKIFKFWWKCAKCGRLERNQDNVEVDHIEEVGSWNGSWEDMVHRIYCRQDNLQVLCLTCHAAKTLKFRNAREEFKRRPRRKR